MSKNKCNGVLTPPHALFHPMPLHRFDLKYASREKDILVITDFPITRGNSKKYKDELHAHIKRVEKTSTPKYHKPPASKPAPAKKKARNSHGR